MNYTDLLSTVSDVHSAALRGTAKAVNHLHVLRNWTMGCLIVEFEQHGEDRAAYGERMLRNLCDDLAAKGMTGLGLSTPKGCRTFYRTYPQMGQSAIGQFQAPLTHLQKGQSLIGLLPAPATEAPPQPAAAGAGAAPTPLPAQVLLRLSWTHFLEHIHLEHHWIRLFFQNEHHKGVWTVSESTCQPTHLWLTGNQVPEWPAAHSKSRRNSSELKGKEIPLSTRKASNSARRIPSSSAAFPAEIRPCWYCCQITASATARSIPSSWETTRDAISSGRAMTTDTAGIICHNSLELATLQRGRRSWTAEMGGSTRLNPPINMLQRGSERFGKNGGICRGLLKKDLHLTLLSEKLLNQSRSQLAVPGHHLLDQGTAPVNPSFALAQTQNTKRAREPKTFRAGQFTRCKIIGQGQAARLLGEGQRFRLPQMNPPPPCPR